MNTETKRDIRALIQSDNVKQQMAMVLPKHLTPDRMARVACTAILKTPKLAACRPESLLQALMLCSQAGLEPDGRNAHLIPYGDQVQVIFDWKGLVALARRNGVQNIAADVVCEKDVFEWSRDGDGLHFRHQINFREPRGKMFAAFCIWKDGDQFDGEVMTKDEIDAIRNRSRSGNNGPWVTDYNEMAKKTVVRRSSKKWPLDAELAEAAMVDETSAAPAVVRPLFSTELPETTESSSDEIPMGEPAKATQQEQPKTSSVNYVKSVRGLCKLAKIEESTLLDYMRSTQGLDDSLSSLEEVALNSMDHLKQVNDKWPVVEAEIKKVMAKG